MLLSHRLLSAVPQRTSRQLMPTSHAELLSTVKLCELGRGAATKVKPLPADHTGVEVSQCGLISRVSGINQFLLLQVWAAHIATQRSVESQLLARKGDWYCTDISSGSFTSC